MSDFECRGCGEPVRSTFLDLGKTPLANSLLRNREDPEPVYDLHVKVCEACLLVQLPVTVAPTEIFTDYAYYSSYSNSWLDAARAYAEWAYELFLGSPDDWVLEIGSNDGYLLQYFARLGASVLGVDPAANIAPVARAKGVPTLVRFFDQDLAAELAAEGHRPKLLVANNVVAHVPDLRGFLTGVHDVLAEDGVFSVEFPHLVRLCEGLQFDTIYHEHLSYFSLLALEPVLSASGLELFGVQPLTSHGGSLRLLVQRIEGGSQPIDGSVALAMDEERRLGYGGFGTYLRFAPRVRQLGIEIRNFLVQEKDRGATIAAYGAAAKGNTLLNYCRLSSDVIDFVVDRNPHKQDRYTPGSRIPIVPPERLYEERPDYVLLLAWNLSDEIMTEHSRIRDWNGRFVVPVPEIRVV